jgi:hypothetical protein
MPAPIQSSIKTKVIRQWLAGDSRPKIAIDNNVGEGTVSGIVSEFKIGLDNVEFDSARELALAAKKQGLSPSDLASRTRLYNYLQSSGTAEEDIESFITNINSGDISPENIVQYVNQLFAVSSEQSIPLDQVPNYIKKKLEEKKKIDDQIKQADAILQSKNVSIEAIDEHIRLKEELKKYRLSTKDIRRLVNLLLAAKEYRYSAGKIVGKLRSIKGLENKENRLKSSCDVLSKQADKYKGIIPLAQLIWDLHIGKNELISFKVAVCEAAELFGFPRSTAAVYVLNNLRDYNKKGQLKNELSSLYLQKYTVEQFCSRQSQAIMALTNLQSHGITEERIVQLNTMLENNGYKAINSNGY